MRASLPLFCFGAKDAPFFVIRQTLFVKLLGPEPRDDYDGIELTLAAQRLVNEMRPVEPGQQVLITADTAADQRVVKATADAVYATGATPTLITYPTNEKPMQQPPPPVAAAAAVVDIWINFAVAYLLYTPAYHTAVNGGCIYVELTGMDVDMIVRMIGRVPQKPLQQMARCLYEMSQAAHTVCVTSPAGTDLTMTIDKAGDPFWAPPPAAGGYPQMLGGQSGFMAYREGYAGTLVFDGALWPPVELGVLQAPVHLSRE